MALSPKWQDFSQEYSSYDSYWYVPKGGTADKDEFREQFRVFDLYEGELWTPELQRELAAELRREGLSRGGNALPRQIKRVFENMGLCWIEDGQPLRTTPAGRAFLKEAAGRSAVLDQQVWRYQLPNPVNATATTAGISLHPHAFLVEVLLKCGSRISGDELVLFVSRARTQGDLAKTVERVRSWRLISEKEQREVIKSLSGSKYSTIESNHSYSMAFHHCDLLLERRAGELFVPAGNVSKLADRLARHKRVSEIIKFENEPDCIAFYGDPEHKGTQLEALDYYVDISDVSRAVEVFKKLPASVRGEMTPEEFEKEQFLEKDLEDFLVKNLDKVEKGLKFIRRQQPTKVGPIDIFASAKNGDLVVLELKKGRASDKVFGQICRYMGCIKSDNKSKPPHVRGYIVGRSVDEKLVYATKVVPDGVIGLQTFDFEGDKGSTSWINVSNA